MRHVVLIACASQKRPHASPAGELYTSALFTKGLNYAHGLDPDAIFILSAKHGLLALDAMTAPYDLTLNAMAARERRAWADGVLSALRATASLDGDRFTFLAGARYREHLVPHMAHVEVPLVGLGIGKQLQFLTDKKKPRLEGRG